MSLASQLKKLAPALAAVAAVACVWLALRALAHQLPGPPGFDVEIVRGTNILTRARADELMTPEVAPTPPPGATLTARATYLAREAGRYSWQLGCTAFCSLRVDGQNVFAPRPGRVAAKEQLLDAGLHELEVVMPNADAAGGVAFAVRLPSSPWRSPLLGPGDVVAAPRAAVEKRLGRHAVGVMHLLVVGPFLVTLALVLVALALIGRARRDRLRAYCSLLSTLPITPSLLTFAAAIAIVLPMIAPLAAPGFYACHEEESYIVRLFEYDAALRNGVPLGRWWPDPVLGRGYPFLCLYAPLLYLVSTPFLLAGISPLVTIKIVTALLICVGAAAIYATARRRGSRPAALLATALFTYAPYLQTDVWIRQDLAESLGFACFPLALFTLDGALDRRPAGAPPAYGSVAAVAFTLFLLGACHNITAYFSLYFLLLWLVLRIAARTTDRAAILRVLAGGGLAIVLTAFFVVPALVDRNRVWVERIISGYYDALRNFVPVSTTLTTEPRWDMRTFVGAAQSIVLGVALAAVIARRPRGEAASGPHAIHASTAATANARLLAITAALGVFVALAIATEPLGRPFVLYVPLARNVAFPWRLFVFAACLAPLAAPAALDGFVRRANMRWIVSLLACAAIVIELAPVYGPKAPLVRSHLDVPAFLRSLDIDYVTSMNEYLPRTVVHQVPRFGEVAHVIAGQAQLTSLSRSAGKYDVGVRSQTDAEIEFNAHWFPGWCAFVDGNEVAIGPRHDLDAGGLIRVRVAPGTHGIALRYGRTALRLACDLVSLAGFIFVAALAALALRQKLLRSRRAEEAQG
jgi:hypothetical protein